MNYFINGAVITVRRNSWTSRAPSYQGVSAFSWWPLKNVTKQDERAAELTGALKTLWQNEPVESRRPHVIGDLEFLRSYLEACDRLEIGPLCVLVCASPERSEATPEWLGALQTGCERLGIDVTYPSGSYSFVDDDFFPANGEIFEFLKTHLNRRGLFDCPKDAVEFIRLHQAANDRGANLEILDNVTPVELWMDADLSRLRAICKQVSVC